MGERGMIFSGPMVRALLDGRKTQTRRVFVLPAPYAPNDDITVELATGSIKPGFSIGDRLWVRETWWHPEPYSYGTLPSGEEMSCPKMVSRYAPVHFAADGDPQSTPNRTYPNGFCAGSPCFAAPDPWAIWTKRASIHMPRWASRLTLAVTDVRVRRLQDISEADADAEGFAGDFPWRLAPDVFPEPHDQWGALSIPECYGILWNSLHGSGAWDANPWVAAISFETERASASIAGAPK